MYKKITTWYLAVAMFMFGILKFVNPFKAWYSVQIANSGLGKFSYIIGILGEVSVGLTLIICLLYRNKMSTRLYGQLTNITFVVIIIMMGTAIYVHLNPNVPAEVLPLKIKQPFIPIFFMLIAFSNLVLSLQDVSRQIENQKA